MDQTFLAPPAVHRVRHLRSGDCAPATAHLGGLTVELTMVAALLIGLVAATILVEASIRRSDVGVGLVVALAIVEELEGPDLTLVVGPATFLPRDAILGVLLVAVVARLLRAGHVTRFQRLWMAFGGVVTWSLVRGAQANGYPGALNEGRKFLIFFVVALYFATVETHPRLWERIGKLWLLGGVALAGLSIVRWIGNSAGLTGVVFGDGYDLRVVAASRALIIAQAGLVALPLLQRPEFGRLRWLSPPLLMVVVLLQHRTVWVITLLSVLYIVVRERSLSRQFLAALSVAVLLISALMFTVFDGEEQEIIDELAVSAQSTGTFEWRVDGWMALLRDAGPEGPLEIAAGRPFGGGWERTFNGMTISVSPHSFYVEPYLRLGLVGLGLMLLLYARALHRTAPARGDGGGVPPPLSTSMLHVLLAGQLLYYVTYTPDAGQAMVLGLAYAAATRAAGHSSGRGVRAFSRASVQGSR